MTPAPLFLLLAAAIVEQVPTPQPTPSPYVAPSVTPAGIAVEQTSPGSRAGLELVESFDGIGRGFSGPQGVVPVRNPSDNSLAVGPDHIVQTVNGAGMAVFTRKGKRFDTTGRVLYGPVRANNVFKGFGGNCEARVSGDVVVRYDQLADRWLIVMPLFSRGPVRPDQIAPAPPGVTQLSVPGVANQPGPAAMLYQPTPAVPTPTPVPGPRPSPSPGPQGPYSMCYAISATPDPLGAYYRYEFLRPLFPDYPRPAIWTDGYYVPTSTSDDRISPAVATEKHACVVDRERMLKGQKATEQCVILHDVNFLNNADIDGQALPPKGSPNIMMAAGGRQLDGILEDDVIHAWQFHVDWKDPKKTRVTGPQVIKVAPYHYLCGGQLTYCVPQPGSTLRLDAQGDKLMARLVYRKVNGQESLVAAHSIDTAGGGGGVRWYEFRVDGDKTRNVRLHQQGTYAPDGAFRWLPSPAMDRFGNIGIGYSFGGSPNFAGQRFAGREPNDPKGQLTLRETVLVHGEAADGGPGAERPRTQRWEDYTQTAVDPIDDCTIWYVGDYVQKDAVSYSTRIGAFRMPGCSVEATRPTTPVPQPLFPGSDLTGWEYIAGTAAGITRVTTVRDGVVSVAGKPNGYLVTKAPFSEYSLHAEWRWTDTENPTPNGGVLIHVSSDPVQQNLWPTSFQVQLKAGRAGDVLNMGQARFAEVPSTLGTATSPSSVLTRREASSEKPFGEWNVVDIKVRGGAIDVVINGVIQNRVTQCSPSSGRIGFQLEGHPFELRNVTVTP